MQVLVAAALWWAMAGALACLSAVHWHDYLRHGGKRSVLVHAMVCLVGSLHAAVLPLAALGDLERGQDWAEYFANASFIVGWALLIPAATSTAKRTLSGIDRGFLGSAVVLIAAFWFVGVDGTNSSLPNAFRSIWRPAAIPSLTFRIVVVVFSWCVLLRLAWVGQQVVRRGEVTVGGILLAAPMCATLELAFLGEGTSFSLGPTTFETSFTLAVLVLSLGIPALVRRNDGWKELRLTLEESQRKWRDLFENSSDAIFVHDACDGRIIEVNRTVYSIYGYTAEECALLSISDLSAPGFERLQQRVFSQVIDSTAKEGSVFLWQAKRKDGTEFPAEVTLKHMVLSGRSRIVSGVRDISERVAQATALQREQTFVSTLLDSLPGAFHLYDRELRLQRWNRNLELSTGYSAEQLRNMPMERWFSDAEKGPVLKDVRSWLLEGPGSLTREAKLRRADGLLVPYLITAARLDTHEGPMLMGVGLDISGLTSAQEALKESEERYRVIFESAENAILLVCDDRIVDCNPQAIRTFGCESREQILALTPVELSPPLQPGGEPSALTFAARMAAGTRGEPQHFEWLQRRFDGTPFLAEVTLTRIVLRGLGHLQILLRDITEKRRLEERLLQAQRLEAIGHLAGGVAHDFNNLLTPILGRVELMLLDVPEGEPMRQDLVEVHAAARRAKQLTRQLLTFGRRAVLEVAPIDLCQLILGMERLLRDLLREDVQLKLNLDMEEVIVRADPSQIEQVIMNLVVNARDAMPKGGFVSLGVSKQAVDAEFCSTDRACAPGAYAVIAVSDTGIGMQPEVRKRLFEPFFTTKSVGKGTGLGLSTVLGIVEQHRGTLTVYSEVGRGSTFKVFLPLEKGSAPPLTSTEVVEGEFKGDEAILVVEDDDAVRAFACRSLERFGYRTASAASPEEALAIFDGLPEPPRLLLTDVIMPGKNGHELYGELLLRRGDLRVLYMSGYSGDTISHQGVLDSGLVLLQKPFPVRELVMKVRQVLDAGSRRS
jgi:PAS domain S-box-containing protein